VATAPKFRIEVDSHNLLMHSAPGPVAVPAAKGMKFPDPVFPAFPSACVCCPTTFIPLPTTFFWSTSATSTVGIAGPTRTRSRSQRD